MKGVSLCFWLRTSRAHEQDSAPFAYKPFIDFKRLLVKIWIRHFVSPWSISLIFMAAQAAEERDTSNSGTNDEESEY